jgi:hypothetical protein
MVLGLQLSTLNFDDLIHQIPILICSYGFFCFFDDNWIDPKSVFYSFSLILLINIYIF